MALRLKDPGKIKHFQKAHGLKVSGKLDKQTSRKVRVHNRNATKPKQRSSPAPKQPRDPLQHQANMQAVAEYAPQIQAAKGQVAVSGEQLQRTGNWFDDYMRKVADAQQQTADAYTNVQNRLQGEGASADAADRASNNQVAQRMAADAASRGAQVDPSIQATANQAASSRRAGIQTMLANLGTQAASSTQAFAERGAVASGAKANALVAETNRGRNLKTALGQLRSQRTAKAQVDRGVLAKQELDQQIAEQGLGIKIGALNNQTQTVKNQGKALGLLAQDRGAKNKLTKRGQNLTHGDRAATRRQAEAKDAYQRKHHTGPYKPASTPKGPKKGPTRAQHVKAQQQFETGRNLLAANPSAKKGSQDQVVAFLHSKGIPVDIGLAAYQYHRFGGAGPQTRKKLKNRYRLKVHGFPPRDNTGTSVGQAVGGG